MAGLKSTGGASNLWSSIKKKLNNGGAGAATDAGASSSNKQSKTTNGGSRPNSMAPAETLSNGTDDNGGPSAPPPEKKKRTRKPKAETDGEKPPPRKRAKKEPLGVKIEPNTSPLVEVFPSPKTTAPIKTEEGTETGVTDGEILGDANEAAGDPYAQDNEAGDLLDQLDQDAGEDA